MNVFTLLSLLLLLFGVTSNTAAQTAARNVNPEAVEFDLDPQAGVSGYRVDFFMAGADTVRDTPVKSVDIGPGARGADGRVRVRLNDLLLDIPNGSYVATIRGTGAAITPQSPPSDVFVLSRQGSPEDRVTAARRERVWTKIGIAIAAGLLLTPVIF